MDITTYENLVTSEHADKQKFTSTIGISCQPFVDITNKISQFPSLYDVDNAVGNQLDVVGQWVGISRNLSIPLTGVYFTLDTGPGLDSGILIGSFDPTTGLVSLPDEFYRLLIYARIINNHWDGTREGAYSFGNIIFSQFGFNLFIADNANLTINIGLSGGTSKPSAIVVAMLLNKLLDIKPSTIRIANYIYQAVGGKIFMLDAPAISTDFGGLDSGHLAIVIQN